jgi:aryl-alcohol dehydrogenase-like predicted oxidoreductase
LALDEGFTTFDLADIYGPAEDFVGSFSAASSNTPLAKKCQFFTKWVPLPKEIPRSEAVAAIDRSLRRMQTDSLDLLQFHW